MMKYASLTAEEVQQEYNTLLEQFEGYKAEKLKLNMARGKPGKEQLDMVADILTVLSDPADCIVDGEDVRNYGGFTGIAPAKKLFAEILGCRPEQCFIGGNASLSLMYDVFVKAYIHGLLHSPRPWSQEEKVKFLCPAPGYDRHFLISQTFGMELITIPMTDQGPDMDLVEQYAADPTVKGIWCVPKYSNPDGVVYSDETIGRLAALRHAAPDFLLMWDNAYCVHDLGMYIPMTDILSLCEVTGNADMVFEFASTSKITLPGAGISVMATSEANLAYMEKLIHPQTISYDKVNQLRHALYLKDKEHVLELMAKHAEIMRPKFRMVVNMLEKEIAPLEIASWKRPMGGYFVSVNTESGLAKRTLALCKEAGVVMTAAGSTFPYGIDPQDSNIRIAPTLPSVEELEKAMQIFCVSLRLAALEKRMQA